MIMQFEFFEDGFYICCKNGLGVLFVVNCCDDCDKFLNDQGVVVVLKGQNGIVDIIVVDGGDQLDLGDVFVNFVCFCLVFVLKFRKFFVQIDKIFVLVFLIVQEFECFQDFVKFCGYGVGFLWSLVIDIVFMC